MWIFTKSTIKVDIITSMVHAFVASRLGYCNSLLYGLPISQISKLQLLQNAAARLVTRSKKCVHITPILRELHWLPILELIKFKILLIVFKTMNNQGPTYLSELISLYVPQRALRSGHKTPVENRQEQDSLLRFPGFLYCSSITMESIAGQLAILA